jgi:type IV pilus assembly protein PilC
MALEFPNSQIINSPVTKAENPMSHLSIRVTTRDRKFFTEQLALLLETGNTLTSSLEIISSQAENKALSQVIDDIIDQINGGKPFSVALTKYPDIFSSTYTTLIAASEKGGYMDNILKHILDMEEKREELISTLASAFTYPVFLVAFASAVIIFILAFVFPKFEDMFSSIKDQLPSITLALMWLSDLTRNYWWVMVTVAISVIGILTWSYNNPGGKKKLNDLLTSIPLLGELIYEIYLIQTMRIIGLSLANGVTLIEAIQVCRDIVENTQFQVFIERLHKNVTDGKNFAIGFSETAFVPSLISQMVKTGEESGKLALVSSRIADYYQQDLSRKLKSLAKMIEPVMLLVMGVVVGLIVSSLILPIFKLSRAVH